MKNLLGPYKRTKLGGDVENLAFARINLETGAKYFVWCISDPGSADYWKNVYSYNKKIFSSKEEAMLDLDQALMDKDFKLLNDDQYEKLCLLA